MNALMKNLALWIWWYKRKRARAAEAEEQPVLLLHDQFSGTGLLANHDPDTVWHWDNWQAVGSTAGGAFTLNGSGGVSNTFNPASGTHLFGAIIQVASNEVNLEVTLTTPATGSFVVGAMFRYVSLSNFFYVRLNSTTGLVELVHNTGSEIVRASVAMTLTNDTEYTIGARCVGSNITAYATGSGGTVTATPYDAGSTNRFATICGIVEIATPTSTHSTFTNFRAQHAEGASVTKSRIFYSPAEAAIASEWDGAPDISGTASATHNSTLDIYEAQITANGTGANDGVRFDFHCDDTGQTPAKKASNALKNLPDFAVHTWYVWIPLTERVGSFWLLWQQKQRITGNSTLPLISLNLGWNGSAMVTEMNNNITNGAYDENAPDLSSSGVVFPPSEWVRVDMYYKWHATDGRVALWIDGTLVYDFDHIATMLSTPVEDLQPGHFPRTGGPGHYASHLSPNTVKIFLDTYSVHVPSAFGELPPDEYPVVSPV